MRERVGLLFRGCSCSSVTACSTRHCSCVSKGIKLSVVQDASIKIAPMQSIQQLVLPTPQECIDDILEIEQEELQHLHLNSVLMIF